MKLTLVFLLILLVSCSRLPGKKNTVAGIGNKYSVIKEKAISFGYDNGVVDYRPDPGGSYELLVKSLTDTGRFRDYYGKYHILKLSSEGDVWDTLNKPFPDWHFSRAGVVKLGDYYYQIGTDSRTMGGSTTDSLNKRDKNWNLVWTKKINLHKAPDGNTILQLSGSNDLLVIADDFVGSADKKIGQTIVIDRYSPEGIILSHKRYVKSYYTNPQSLTHTSDNKYLLTVWTANLPNANNVQPMNTWLLKLELNGDTIWTRSVPDFYPRQTVETIDGFLLYGSGFRDEAGQSYEYIKIVKTDKKGSVVSTTELNKNYLESSGNMLQLANGNYLFSGSVEHIKNTYQTPVILELDPHGNRILEKNFEYRTSDAPLLLQGNKKILMLFGKDTGTHTDGSFRTALVISTLSE